MSQLFPDLFSERSVWLLMSKRHPLRDKFRANTNPFVSDRDIGEILRGVAKAREATGDIEGARRARKGARTIERRDGAGEPYRKHRKTGQAPRKSYTYWDPS